MSDINMKFSNFNFAVQRHGPRRATMHVKGHAVLAVKLKTPYRGLLKSEVLIGFDACSIRTMKFYQNTGQNETRIGWCYWIMAVVVNQTISFASMLISDMAWVAAKFLYDLLSHGLAKKTISLRSEFTLNGAAPYNISALIAPKVYCYERLVELNTRFRRGLGTLRLYNCHWNHCRARDDSSEAIIQLFLS